MESLYRLNKNNYEILEIPIFLKIELLGNLKFPKLKFLELLKI